MQTKKSTIARPWALVLAILFTLVALHNFFSISFSPLDSYAIGQVVGTILFPGLFWFLAFKPKREKDTSGE